MASPSITIARLIDQVLLAADSFLASPSIRAVNTGSKFLVNDKYLSLYARAHLGPVGRYRYASLQVSRAGGPRIFVIANIELAQELQQKGFLTKLLAAITASAQFDVIEFENVLNPSLVSWLRRHGYIAKDECTLGGSFFKVLNDPEPQQPSSGLLNLVENLDHGPT